ncbi:uncharacterized protein PWA37_005288 [Arxiozyma heterogenica]|uniref:uncharacterized protein n=1 Tax=Arxiozyma heterogenica TaxID=278026 RepID=UPI002EF3F3F3
MYLFILYYCSCFKIFQPFLVVSFSVRNSFLSLYMNFKFSSHIFLFVPSLSHSVLFDVLQNYDFPYFSHKARMYYFLFSMLLQRLPCIIMEFKTSLYSFVLSILFFFILLLLLLLLFYFVFSFLPLVHKIYTVQYYYEILFFFSHVRYNKTTRD